MMITNEGIIIRMAVKDISIIGRNTSGVKLKDTVVTGNLYLSGGVGLGNVELENVEESTAFSSTVTTFATPWAI